jgi:eukaryotic-like serine/threonine-protein kinase
VEAVSLFLSQSVIDDHFNKRPRERPKARLTVARRNLLDRLMDELMDVEGSLREQELDRIRRRAPRVHRWLVALISASDESGGAIDDLFQRAGKAARQAGASRELVLSPGERLGVWRVIESVGSGGMGAVYRAKRADGAFEMTVAIKLIRVRRENLDERLKIERQLLARLNHRNIARLIDGGATADGHAYLVMEWIAGHDLDVYLDRHERDLSARLDLFEQIIEAVGHAHQRQVVHGDLKPANVRVTESGQIRLVDFGVARLIHEEDDTKSAGSGALTPAFCAPEQLRGESASTQSDIWSLGVLLQWLLSGEIRLAKPGLSIDHELPSDLAYRKDLIAIIDRACAENPDERYAGVSQLMDDVRRCRQVFPVQARRQTRTYVLSRFIRRHRLAAAITATVSAVLCLAVIAALWQAHHATLQRDRAELEAERAIQAEQQSEQLAEELQQVVDFQSARLAAVDPAAMGIGLRQEILDKRRSALQTLTEDPGQIERGLERLDQSLTGVNFTDVALASMDRNIFEPTLETIDREFAGHPLLRARLLQVTATTMRELGIRERTEAPQTQALQIRRELLGDDDPDTLRSISEMGALRGQMGQLEEQRRLYREAMIGYRELLGERHVHTLTATGSMGAHYSRSGELELAEHYFVDGLEKSRESLGSDHSQTLTALNNMGTLLGDQELFDEAMPYFREVLDIRRRRIGDKHPDTLSSVNNMGWLLQQKGRLDDALPYYREALDGRRQVLGNDHPSTMLSVNNMSFLLGALGRHEEAEPFSLEVVQNARRMYGNDHHRTLIFINNRSSLLQSLGRYEEAEALAADVVERGHRALPPGHWHLAVFQGRLALTLVAQNRHAEAEAPLLKAYEIYQAALGDDNSRTMDIANELSDLYAILHESEPDGDHGVAAEAWRPRADKE